VCNADYRLTAWVRRVVRLPADVCFSEEPQIVRWDYEAMQWRTDGFIDKLYNECELILSQPRRNSRVTLLLPIHTARHGRVVSCQAVWIARYCLFSMPAVVNTWVRWLVASLTCVSVCVRESTLWKKQKRLELLTPNLVHLYSLAGPPHALT